MSNRMSAMRVRTLHPWDLPLAEAGRLQERLALSVQEETFDPAGARYIAGLDVSSDKENPILTAGVIVWDRITEEIVDASSVQGTAPFPYVPGFLSFREAPVLLEALRALRIEPDILLVDGHGRAHPRRLGIASHIGLCVDVPTVGIAKSILCGKGTEPADRADAWTTLIDDTEEVGRIVRTRKGVTPVIVSVGNRITLDGAVTLTLACCRGYRLPEPTRLAHQHVNLARTTGKGLVPAGVEQMQLL
ncbi:MAG: deoxyribonuclease V [Candidatus Peregrinibacteria bacterium Greene0416_19]|nr:MAG: deoxyribonuclease V [Candidatus Peregrinibacteria bacterium Greene0416_19]